MRYAMMTGAFLLTVAGMGAQTTPKFEVASVKRMERCEPYTSIDPGSVTLRGIPLKPVLREAFQVKPEQIEGPAWLETECFDISAKIPEGVGREQLPAMLQALLTERFRLAVHKEDRQVSGYVLVVEKGGPKFKEDDPKTEFMGPGRAGQMMFGASGHGILKGVISMATLASNLSREGYGPVQDLTGLPGKYDIELRWAKDPASADAELGADLFRALRESLGLKMEKRSVQVQYVVIEHIERVPTEN